MPDKPRILITSTIYDFKDLRSALKYWLEEYGYEVMLSEYNDFDKQLDENSYKACIGAVEKAQYLILLIGTRTGGAFSREDKLTITRMEYRRAYQLLQEKKMKLVTFVRKEVWDVKEDRKALEQLLIKDEQLQRELSEKDIARIVHHSSKFTNDAEVTFDFLNEVVRAEEMRKAIAGEGEYPKGNWVHQFTTFGEIIDTLKRELNLHDSLSKQALVLNLERELLANLKVLFIKLNERIEPFYFLAAHAREKYDGSYSATSHIPSKYLARLSIFIDAFTSRSPALSTQFIDYALNSGEFLEYNLASNTFKNSLLVESLNKLRFNIDRLKDLEMDEDFLGRKIQIAEKYKNRENIDTAVPIKNAELLHVFSICDTQQNIVSLCIQILRAIRGDDKRLSTLRLNSTTPLTGKTAEEVARELITLTEIEEMIFG